MTVPTTGSPSMPRLAAGQDGRVLIAWLDRTATGTGVQAVSRSPEGTLGPPIALARAPEDARAPSLVAAANGEPLLAYVDGGGVLRLRRMRPDGTPIGPAARISGSTERTNGAALAVTPSATQIVWSTATSVRARRIAPGGSARPGPDPRARGRRRRGGPGRCRRQHGRRRRRMGGGRTGPAGPRARLS